jgi:hypothetical protein
MRLLPAPPLLFRAVAVLMPWLCANAAAVDLDLTLGVEGRSFYANPSLPGQFDDDAGASLELDLQGRFNKGETQWRFTTFGRWDSRDPERRHADIREGYLLHVVNDWEFLAGVSKVFWGVAESSHLVDIINQTDFLEGIDGEDKLGQPMLRASRSFDQSALTLFVLPGFREREFRSADDPLSLPFAVDDTPSYESGRGADHVDYALRYSGYHDIIDYGLSWFRGTSRDPGFVPAAGGRLTPFYPQIEQFGLDLQATSDAWLWKLEIIRREFDDPASGEDYNAGVGGAEYTLFGMGEGRYDLGLLAELHRDSRGDPATVQFQDDLFLGARFGFTDVAGTELLIGSFVDLDDDTRLFRVEGSRRVFDSARLSLEIQGFSNVDPENINNHLRDSDFLLLSLEWFY